MAEIAIPIAALGVMYILSNKDKKKTVESFETSRTTPSKIPNTTIPVVNYPIETYDELKDNPSHYNEPNNLKQRYYDPKVHKAVAKEENQEINNEKFVDLVGREIDKSNLKHANMQPFFGSNVTQGGVGDKRNPPVYMVPGDIVEVDIGLLGVYLCLLHAIKANPELIEAS